MLNKCLEKSSTTAKKSHDRKEKVEGYELNYELHLFLNSWLRTS